ncbi:30S ribosomal protein S1 [Clostridium tarantellae]|uniref:30S ribosomal protein S1 n=1 Tax=Clostridium tarantellae TaxID=39493 RepID=A0A6I1MJN7_9CLOT|nr:30S ribosomal protein S1 [Clostridium tarantellae]MPQ43595.1 30S ribosomal protein S1 [Clostridium tarantellae]
MEENMSMKDLMDSFELKHFHKGDIVKGKVISVKNDEVIVNIGHFADGVIPKSEISNNKDFNIDDIKVDSEIYVMVLSGDDGEGNVLLSKKKADSIKVWDDLEKDFEKENLIKVKFSQVVKGGIVGDLNSVRIFMPASQCASRRVENLEELIGKTLDVKVIEFEKNKKKVVVSRRIVEEEIKNKEKQVLWKSIKVGEKRRGKVVKLVKFGAFVEVSGVQGLVHLNDLSWSRVNKPEEVVNVGDEVEVYIQEIDMDKERLSLSLKDVVKNPWHTSIKKYKINDILDGEVSKFIKAGAFIEIEPGIEGFVHLSEICYDNIAKASDVLQLGQKVKVKILDINADEHKLSLSIKDASEKSKEYLEYNDNEEGFSLGDLFKDFKF